MRSDAMGDQNLHDTAELPLPGLTGPETDGLIEPKTQRGVRAEVDLAGLSDQGRRRANNEDTFFIARFDRTMRALQSNVPWGEFPETSAETTYGMLVADGMGGHAAGEVASRTAALVLLDQVLKTPDWIMRFDESLLSELIRRTEQRLQEIQGALRDQARVDSGLAGMGTTLTFAWSLGPDLFVAHVGDSRAYLMRTGQLEQLTNDHTFAQAMVEAGTLTAEQAARHRLRHVLTGVLTTGGGKVPFEFRHLRLQDGDQVLLCSDGLTEMVAEPVIADVLGRPGSAEAICRELVATALEAGGRDNVTVTLARYRFREACEIGTVRDTNVDGHC
jgi:serine/threonine protein phosphatase PrpC